MIARLVKAFTSNPSVGNPAGVVLDASKLSDDEMQSIALDLGYSESAFVLPSMTADYKVRFFSVSGEVSYCGHATVAAYQLLFELPENRNKQTLTQETRAGIFTIKKDVSGKITMNQKDPVFGEVENDRIKLAKILNVSVNDFSSDMPSQVVITNSAKLIVPMASVNVLRSMCPDMSAIADYTKSHDGKGLYCFTQSDNSICDLFARSFNPEIGIDEDPATGVAAGPLACYADRYLYNRNKKDIRIRQGMWMDKTSDIFVSLKEGVEVSGYAVEFGEREYSFSDKQLMRYSQMVDII